MHVQVKEQSLVIFTFKSLNYMNIGSWKECVNTHDRPFSNRVSLNCDKNDNKSVLRACNLNLKAEIYTTTIFQCFSQIWIHMTHNFARDIKFRAIYMYAFRNIQAIQKLEVLVLTGGAIFRCNRNKPLPLLLKV